MDFDFKRSFKGTISIIGTSQISSATEKVTVELGRLLAKNHFAICRMNNKAAKLAFNNISLPIDCTIYTS